MRCVHSVLYNNNKMRKRKAVVRKQKKRSTSSTSRRRTNKGKTCKVFKNVSKRRPGKCGKYSKKTCLAMGMNRKCALYSPYHCERRVRRRCARFNDLGYDEDDSNGGSADGGGGGGGRYGGSGLYNYVAPGPSGGGIVGLLTNGNVDTNPYSSSSAARYGGGGLYNNAGPGGDGIYVNAEEAPEIVGALEYPIAGNPAKLMRESFLAAINGQNDQALAKNRELTAYLSKEYNARKLRAFEAHVLSEINRRIQHQRRIRNLKPQNYENDRKYQEAQVYIEYATTIVGLIDQRLGMLRGG